MNIAVPSAVPPGILEKGPTWMAVPVVIRKNILDKTYAQIAAEGLGDTEWNKANEALWQAVWEHIGLTTHQRGQAPWADMGKQLTLLSPVKPTDPELREAQTKLVAAAAKGEQLYTLAHDIVQERAKTEAGMRAKAQGEKTTSASGWTR